MTDKFIPFNPETAKNGAVTYYSGNHDWSYIYIGPCVDKTDAYVAYNPRDKSYSFCWNKEMLVKAPKKTVWVNIYTCGTAYHYPTEDKARQAYKGLQHIGTYPLEIDDVA